jgi:hypothetical protein
VGIPIPISLIVTTITKTVSKSETPEDALSIPDKPLFPPPPQGPEGVRLLLDATVNIKARGRHAMMENHLMSLGGFGESSTDSARNVQVTTSDPVWLPNAEKGEEGKWKREVRFDTTMLLKCPPTFTLDIVRCAVRYFPFLFRYTS